MIFLARLIALVLFVCAVATAALPFIPDDPAYAVAMGFDLRAYAAIAADLLAPVAALGLAAVLVLLARALSGEG